jgi:SAM-dependent methyltransferase
VEAVVRDRRPAGDGKLLLELGRRASGWPGRILRSPSRTESHYLHHRRLLVTLARAIEQNLEWDRRYSVLDVGSGNKPYYPLLAPYAGRYAGVDPSATTASDVRGVAEMLPFRDDCADVVLATQILEHVGDPLATLREWHRTLRPGGLVFASTHGTSYYHPIPTDHWRWTHTGLRKLFTEAGFRVRSVEACERTLTTLSLILGIHAAGTANRLKLGAPMRLALIPFHLLVELLDGVGRRPPQSEAELGWGAMPWTYLVVAEKR